MSCMTSYVPIRLLLAFILTIQSVGLVLMDVIDANTRKPELLVLQTTT